MTYLMLKLTCREVVEILQRFHRHLIKCLLGICGENGLAMHDKRLEGTGFCNTFFGSSCRNEGK